MVNEHYRYAAVDRVSDDEELIFMARCKVGDPAALVYLRDVMAGTRGTLQTRRKMQQRIDRFVCRRSS